jgi:hypothetical protein
MGKWLKWLAVAGALGVLLLAGVAVALQQWLRTDDFRARVEKEAAAALGVPLKLGRLSVDLFPLPAVAVDQVRVQTRPALTVERVEARPVWAALVAGRLEIKTLVVRKAVLPQTGIAALAAAMQKGSAAANKKAPPPSASTPLVLPRSVHLEDITWVDDKGQPLTVDAHADLGDDGLLDSASFKVVAGRFNGAHGEIKHEGEQWPLDIAIGGGHVKGKLQLQAGKAAGAQLLTGQLATDNVEVAALTAPSKPLTGKLQAQTTLRSEYKEPGQVVDMLQTTTHFTVHDAVLQGIDLAKAVQTVGLSRGGVTHLDTLAGQVNTQGKTVHLTNLVATSGSLSATGNVTLAADHSLSGRVAVDLAHGAIGVPLAVGGTLDDPSVRLTSGAVAGAAVGAATTSIGDKIGNGLRGLFGK